MIRVEVVPVGMFMSNCIIVSCSKTSEGIVVDAGAEAETILYTVKNAGVKVKAVVSTHAHIDHVSALAEVADELKVPAYMHVDDYPVYERVEAAAMMYGLEPPEQMEISKYIEDGETMRVGELTAEFVHAPGHSPGSVCIVFRDELPPRVISGDVLFKGSIGRTDLPGGNFDVIMNTLKTVFLPLPDETVVYPGHGPETTIGEEKLTNPFLAPLTRNGR